ncbi:MAG: MAPEG family protein [Pseudomonadales bacterium]
MATLLYAGILGLLAVLLANNVLYVRLRGDREPAWRADATLRVQANFVENVPLALVLLGLLEYSGIGATATHILGSALVIARLLHAWGLGAYEGANYPRLIGAQGTFLLVSIMAVAAIYQFMRGTISG